jgi:hypothetical protein
MRFLPRSPVVAHFDSQGYRLIGARADYFDRQRAAWTGAVAARTGNSRRSISTHMD